MTVWLHGFDIAARPYVVIYRRDVRTYVYVGVALLLVVLQREEERAYAYSTQLEEEREKVKRVFIYNCIPI